jgi:hypothetical protein
MNFAAAGGPQQMAPGYSGDNSNIRGSMMPMQGGGGTVMNLQQQQQLMMVQQQRRAQVAQQLRCQVPQQQQPAMMDAQGMGAVGPRTVPRRAPPPHYAETVLTHSGPRPMGPNVVDPGPGQFGMNPQMRFRPGGLNDFNAPPISANEVVRYPHDQLSRFGDGTGGPV